MIVGRLDGGGLWPLSQAEADQNDGKTQELRDARHNAEPQITGQQRCGCQHDDFRSLHDAKDRFGLATTPARRSEIKPSEISPIAYRQWCASVGLLADELRE
jgi:hypothetical protein